MDARELALRARLGILTTEELERIKNYSGRLVLDTYCFDGEGFCPLAIAFNLHNTLENPTEGTVRAKILELGSKRVPNFTVSATKGIEGEFFTIDRLRDMMKLLDEELANRDKISQ